MGRVSFRISTKPERCRIYLDGEHLGDSPVFVSDTPINPGEHVIVAEQTFFEPETRKISLDANQRMVECDLVLKHDPGFESYLDGNLLKKLDDGQIFSVIGQAFWLVGPDRDMTYREAVDWISSLDPGWTMPERKDFRSLHGIGWKSWGPFENGGWWVWSYDEELANRVMCISFMQGLASIYGSEDNPNKTRVFAIRRLDRTAEDPPDGTAHHLASQTCPFRGSDPPEGAAEPETRLSYSGGRFLKDPSSEIVEDVRTGLEWLVSLEKRGISHTSAATWVRGMSMRWRLPTCDELKVLFDAGITADNWGPFENDGSRVWSGELDRPDETDDDVPSDELCLDFSNGRVESISRDSSRGFISFAVRNRR